tara:strand:+ start:61 stop:891 length:831 start_codon:yes stop_codon:yes gene_type:complete
VSKLKKEKSNLIDFSTPKVMGILNITTDSFFDGGKYLTKKEIISQIQKIKKEGAQIIDVGASSSRPGSTPVSEKLELERLLPTIELIKENCTDIKISIDTFRSGVAKSCIENGANIINDISAGEYDKKMFETVANHNVPYIMMHMKGDSLTMQNNPTYNNVVEEIMLFFQTKINKLNEMDFNQIIIDPGFGFGKTIEHNYEILKNLKQFKKFKLPVLVGASRKSMIYKLLNGTAKQALNGTSVVNTFSLLNGASILRVHDVKEAVECVKIVDLIKK